MWPFLILQHACLEMGFMRKLVFIGTLKDASLTIQSIFSCWNEKTWSYQNIELVTF